VYTVRYDSRDETINVNVAENETAVAQFAYTKGSANYVRTS